MTDSEDQRDNTPADREARGSTVLDLGGRDANAVWQEMMQIAQTIQNAQVTYDLDLVGDTSGTQNSNSLVSAVMAHVGLDMDAYVPLIAGDDNVGVANTIDQIAYVIDMSGIPGYSGGDILVGGDLGDTLTGGSGADRLTGGAGDDTLIAARPDNDNAVLRAPASPTGYAGRSNVMDYSWLGADFDSDRLDGGAGYDTYVVGMHGGTHFSYSAQGMLTGTSQDRDALVWLHEGGEWIVNPDVFSRLDIVSDSDGQGIVTAGLDGTGFAPGIPISSLQFLDNRIAVFDSHSTTTGWANTTPSCSAK